MDFFNLKNDFTKVVIKSGETDGHLDINNCDQVPPLSKRTKKGPYYAEDLLSIGDELCKPTTSSQEGTRSCGVDELEVTTVGTAVNLHELKSDEVEGIYKEFYENRTKQPNNLIINNYKKKILSLVESNEVVVLTGPTGCGKSTQVPQFILDSHVEQRRPCNIVVTQPRRLAAISVCKRVCDERNWELGSLCGYKIALKDVSSEYTRLTFMTIGVLLQSLSSKKTMNQYTHIILDEVHERTQDMDFLMIVIKKLLRTTSQHVKVILMSATADASKFAGYFLKFYQGKMESAPIISVNSTTNFPVQIFYLDELSPLGQLPDLDPGNPHISDDNYNICVKLIKQFEKLDDNLKNKNSVLVFLPGLYEIEVLYDKLMKPSVHSDGLHKYKWSPLPLHSLITIEEQARVFKPPPLGYRKIILSTNLAESSLTVPGVKYVIDFCITKSLRNDKETNFTSLESCWASQAHCIQRAGRVGRVMSGRVYRMVYRDFYKNLNKDAIPEMLTSPLEKSVLLSKILDMGEPRAILSLALDPPDLSDIEWTILVLKEAGGLLRTRNGVPSIHDGDLTFLGRLMAVMPVNIEMTRLIVLGHIFSCLEECIIMAACMSLKSVFSHSFNMKLEAYNAKLDWADGSCSDLIAFLNVYEVWLNNQKNGYFKRSGGDSEIVWAKRHFVQLRVLKEVKVLVEDLTLRLKQYSIEESIGRGKVQWNEYQKGLVLKIIIAGAFYPNYFGRGVQGGHLDEKTAVKTLCGRNPFTTVYFSNYPAEQPIELYSQLIKDKLKSCKEDMKISTDGHTKVFVEFRDNEGQKEKNGELPFDGTLPGKIPMAVYRAVRLRYIQKMIEINVLPLKEAQKRAEILGIRSRRVSDAVNPSAYSAVIPCELPGADVTFVSLIITHTIDPGHFWAGYNGLDYSETRKRIFHMLNSSSNNFQPFLIPPSVGDICAAPFEDDGEIWFYRARIESISNELSNPTARVFYYDFGNSATLKVSDLKRYNAEMFHAVSKIPAQAFECRLAKVRPSLLKNPKGNWSHEAWDAFEKLIRNGDTVAFVYSVTHGVISVKLFRSNEGQVQLNINKFLIDNGFAEKVEENYLSKTDHEMRKQRRLSTNITYEYKNPQKQSVWTSKYIKPPDEKDRNIPVKLIGPFSPLEMKIYGYTRNSLTKRISINQSSVNSVILDPDPQDKLERLIVAGSVSQSQSDSSLLLNHTTVMPNIRGLAAIVPFIFAPEIELRVDELRTKYIGMLCGLGADEDGNSLFPEHDIEVIFDCEITVEDFKTVNCLRFFMSKMLFTEGDEERPLTSYPDVVKCQKRVQENFLRLLNKQRKQQDVSFPRREHKWGLCQQDLCINSSMAISFSQSSIFRLHRGISIEPTENN